MIPETDEEKEKGYQFLVVLKPDNVLFIWEGRNYRPITNLPKDPDKTGVVDIVGKDLTITIIEKDGSENIRQGKIVKFAKNGIDMEKVIFTIEDGSERTLSHSYCGY